LTTATVPPKTWSGRDIAIFLILTFGITWSVGATAVFAPDWGDAIGPMTWINAGVLVAGALSLVWVLGTRRHTLPQTRQ